MYQYGRVLVGGYWLLRIEEGHLAILIYRHVLQAHEHRRESRRQRSGFWRRMVKGLAFAADTAVRAMSTLSETSDELCISGEKARETVLKSCGDVDLMAVIDATKSRLLHGTASS
jgi:hypothetical protein